MPLRILMCAFACNPTRGSEPGIGWNWAEQASREHEVWVITHTARRSDLESELGKRPNPDLHFVYHSVPGWKWSPQGLVHYILWHLTAIPLARRLHKDQKFDLGHHVTFGAFRYPSFLAWLDVPFVIGPISGAERTPLSFYPSFGLKGVVAEVVRNVTSSFVWAIPLTRTTFKRAKTILIVTDRTRSLLPKWAQFKARKEIAIGITPEPAEHPDNFETPRVLTTGRLIYWKGNYYGVKAFAEFKKHFPNARFTICGDGPEDKRLEKLCAELGVSDSVDFLYNYTHQQALELYANHTIFLSPIIHLNGIAVLEAMNFGMPVVELDSGDDNGPVTKETGIRIPMRDPGQVVQDLADALCRLASDPGLAKAMGRAGQQRIREVYDWNCKRPVIDEIYQETVEDHRS